MSKQLEITSATLLRYNISVDQVPEALIAWNLPFPWQQTCWRIAQQLKDHRNRNRASGEPVLDNLYPPYRMLSNVAMATIPLASAYRWNWRNRSVEPAIFVTTAPNRKPPNADSLTEIVYGWLEWWIKKHTSNDAELRGRLLTLWSRTIDDTPTPEWESHKLVDLLETMDPSLVYDLAPNLVAAALHGRKSLINGQPVRWRRVQDGESKKMYVVGMVDNRPIPAPFTTHKETGELITEPGSFAYKLQFSLKTESGREAPWLFVSAHAQRYSDQPLKTSNRNRRVSFLYGGNRRHLATPEFAHTFVQLRINHEKDKLAEWDDTPPELLQHVAGITLSDPNTIIANPVNFWHPGGERTAIEQDEFYPIHAEGYAYNGRRKMKLKAGLSPGDLAGSADAITTLLPWLTLDQPLQADVVQLPTESKQPDFLRHYTHWSNKPKIKQRKAELDDAFEERLSAEYRRNHLAYQEVITNALAHVTANKPTHIATLYHHDDTQEGLEIALKNALLLSDSDSLKNLTFSSHRIADPHLYTAVLKDREGKKVKRTVGQKQRVADWSDALKKVEFPAGTTRFALVELLDATDQFGKPTGKGCLGVRGAIRAACAAQSITPQMVRTIFMKTDDETKQRVYVNDKDQKGEHRANAATRDLLLRHTGLTFGTLDDLYKLAEVPSLEVLTLYMRRNHNGLQYAIATRLTANGTTFVRLPGRTDWVPYCEAMPVLGRLFSAEWRNMSYDGQKWYIRNKSVSPLAMSGTQLNRFIQNTLASLTVPTLAIIEADKWRNRGTWTQLRNGDLADNAVVLNFKPSGPIIPRDAATHQNLVAILRMKSGEETPQYTTEKTTLFRRANGMYRYENDLLHYYSIGRQLGTSLKQQGAARSAASKTDQKAANIAYKHPQVVEFTPFFVREDWLNSAEQVKLCRLAHLLRHSPAWQHGNIIHPHPMHLAQALLEDQLCILAMDD